MRYTKAILLAAILLPMAAQSWADEGGDSSVPTTTAPVPRRTGGGFGGGGGGGFGGGGVGGFGGGVSLSTTGDGRVEVTGPGGFAWASTEARLDRPTIITTQAIDQAQCREDLSIMQKLVRDQIVQATGEVKVTAMGIKIVLLDSPTPMYIEGAGAVIAARINSPLQAAKEAGDNKEEKVGTGSSAWQQAKAELDAGNSRVDGRLLYKKGSGPTPAVKAEDLIDAIVKILPEATNMRTLKPDENVIVTISGVNDTGVAVRLTLKVKKSDIDDAASGKITAEEFKQRVAHRIG